MFRIIINKIQNNKTVQWPGREDLIACIISVDPSWWCSNLEMQKATAGLLCPQFQDLFAKILLPAFLPHPESRSLCTGLGRLVQWASVHSCNVH